MAQPGHPVFLDTLNRIMRDVETHRQLQQRSEHKRTEGEEDESDRKDRLLDVVSKAFGMEQYEIAWNSNIVLSWTLPVRVFCKSFNPTSSLRICAQIYRHLALAYAALMPYSGICLLDGAYTQGIYQGLLAANA